MATLGETILAKRRKEAVQRWLSIDAPAWLAYLKPAFQIIGARPFGAGLT
ncbi:MULTISPECIES: hypothetical protein [Pacificibacter]|nr:MULTISPECIES: hypothetical protein [Pacificibacter]MBU2935790.1 hypothetical protein [Pacificibacter marinus]MDO6614286.1 hypothetical protein [Pacificibacter sp. 1_MG-2023]